MSSEGSMARSVAQVWTIGRRWPHLRPSAQSTELELKETSIGDGQEHIGRFCEE